MWVLTPDRRHRRRRLRAASARSCRRSGAEVVALPPERHDALVAVVSHVPHLTAATLMGLADERAEEHGALLRLAAGGFRDMTRIAAGHPGIWPDICAENRDAIVEVLDGLDRRRSARCATSWPTATAPGCSAVLERARAARANLPGRVGRPGDLAEVRVPCPTGPASWPRSPPWPASSTSTSPTSRSPTRARATGACSSCSSRPSAAERLRGGAGSTSGYRPSVTALE